MQYTGGRILLECLKEEGVDTIFGYPGGAILNIYDDLYKCGDTFRHILTSHEQGACHAADGYARATGKPGVCFATSGPGSTNLITGLATALLDSSPVVCVTCSVPSDLRGRDSFQEVDIANVTAPVTKHTFSVRSVDRLADTVHEAFAVACSGRPGPVLIDISKDVTSRTADYAPETGPSQRTAGHLRFFTEDYHFEIPALKKESVQLLADMLAAAEKPLILCGGGVVRSRADDSFRCFVHKADVPVAVTVMGTGAIEDRDPLVTGLIGMHGSQASNFAVDQCDLLIAFGCRFSDRVTLTRSGFASQAKIVQIDIDPFEIDKNIRTDHHIIGDARQILELLIPMIGQLDHTEWKAEVFSYPTDTFYDEQPGKLNPGDIFSVIENLAPADAVYATDVGQHQMWAVQHLPFTYSGQLLTSGGFGTMGFGLGAAIGAKAAFPEKQVIHITGDGSFRMNCNELATEAYYELPVISIVFKNGCLGMVRQWQTMLYGQRYSQTTLDRPPDFVKLAEAYDLNGFRAANRTEFEDAFTRALASDRGTVIECVIDIDEKVRPMVNPGGRLSDFLLN
jgi:acetolactate synthase-1/2/3 large subunit